MNAVIFSVLLMLVLSFLGTPVVAAILLAALLAGFIAQMPLQNAIDSFHLGIENGATIALSYAMLGAFAAALNKSMVPSWYCQQLDKYLLATKRHSALLTSFIVLVILLCAIISQNLIPIHIAFIPIIIPSLLILMNKLQLDRRAIACTLTFGLVATYMIIPVGFGAIYIDAILFKNLQLNHIDTNNLSIYQAMWLPVLGMFIGLLIALLFSYRKPRAYQITQQQAQLTKPDQPISIKSPSKRNLIFVVLALVITFISQIYTNSMIIGALVGFCILTLGQVITLKETDHVFLDGMKMMAGIGFVMLSAQGFAQVLKDSGHIIELVNMSSAWLNFSPNLAALLMLIIGLFITMGIGSSFSTVPIIAAIFIPIADQLGFSPLAILALIGTAGALGDAGSPVSESTLGPTAGLNADGQHHHIKDSVIPTFIHFNLPLLVFGWLAVILLA